LARLSIAALSKTVYIDDDFAKASGASAMVKRRREIPVDFVCSMIDLSDFWVVAIPIEFGRRESSEQKLGR
jgi:hypothetical protein